MSRTPKPRLKVAEPSRPVPPAPDPQVIVNLLFSLLMAARENTTWLAAQSREEVAAWAAAKLADCGIPTEPVGLSWGILKTQRPARVSEPVLEAWDEVSRAIDAVLTAQPSRMSEASHRLEIERRNMRDIIHREAIGR